MNAGSALPKDAIPSIDDPEFGDEWFGDPDDVLVVRGGSLVKGGTVEGGTVVEGGTSWPIATGESGDGRRLERVPTRRLHAFAWQDDHGADAFYED